MTNPQQLADDIVLADQLSILQRAALARDENAMRALEYLQGVIDRKQKEKGNQK